MSLSCILGGWWVARAVSRRWYLLFKSDQIVRTNNQANVTKNIGGWDHNSRNSRLFPQSQGGGEQSWRVKFTKREQIRYSQENRRWKDAAEIENETVGSWGILVPGENQK